MSNRWLYQVACAFAGVLLAGCAASSAPNYAEVFDHDLTGQVALITGGATGIGRAMAQAVGNAGAKVWLASRNVAAIERSVAELRGNGITAHGAQLDVTERGQVNNLVGDIVG